MEKRRGHCNSYQKWFAEKIKIRAEGRRKANPEARFPAEAGKRAALKLAKMFEKKKLIKSAGVALSANRSVVVDTFVIG